MSNKNAGIQITKVTFRATSEDANKLSPFRVDLSMSWDPSLDKYLADDAIVSNKDMYTYIFDFWDNELDAEYDDLEA